MQNFQEDLFPEDISYGAIGGPEFSTDVITSSSGYEQRNINWRNARNKYNVSYGVRTKEQLEQLIAFFRTKKGRAIGFRFKDWSDYQARNQFIAKADGIINEFQLIKHYKSGDITVTRIINKPVIGTVTIYIDNIQYLPNIDYKTGKFSFLKPPARGSIITANFEFDVPVRFNTDKISSTIEDYGKFSCNEISLIEIKL